MKLGKSIGPNPEKISENNEFDLVEMSIGEIEIDPDNIETKKVREELEKNNLEMIIHLPFRQPLATSVNELNNDVMEYFDRLLETAKVMRAAKGIVHPRTRFEDEKDGWEKLGSQFRELKELEKRFDIEICIENLHQSPDLTKLGEILQKEKMSICFDTGHAYVFYEEEEIDRFLERHGDLCFTSTSTRNLKKQGPPPTNR